MAKRKSSKGDSKGEGPKKKPAAKKGGQFKTQRPRTTTRTQPAPAPAQEGDEATSSLTPAPALPSTKGPTRGGKSTLSTHEFLAEVLPMPPLAPPGETLSLTQIYETLAALLVPYARKMESEMHPKIGFCLKAKNSRTGRETHFGAVQVLPDCVAYHLFPLYAHPDLLKNASPELSKRMRSPTCFHFETLHAAMVAELAELTHAGFERFVADGVV